MPPQRIKMRRIPAFCALLLFVAGCTAPRSDSTGSAVIDRSIRSSVQLFTDRDDNGRRAGSAVVLAADETSGRALILTTAHILLPLVEQKVLAKTPMNRGYTTARIVAVDADADLAVLEAEGLNVVPASLRRQAHLGDDVWVISYPWGRRLTVVDGVVSQIYRRSPASDSAAGPFAGPVRQIDATVAHGTSGGGVYDRRTGELVGIVRGYRTAKLSLPGGGAAPLEVPIAGETTVIPATRILCFLKTAELGAPIPAELRGQIADSRC